MKLLGLTASDQNDSRDRAIINQVLQSQWWVNPLLNPDCGKVEPSPKQAGMEAYADGVSWNPGGLGQGRYYYTGSAWVKLIGPSDTISSATNADTVDNYHLSDIRSYAMVTGSDFTTTSTTVVDITGLTLPLLASSTYEFQMNIVLKSSTAAGLKVNIMASAAISAIEGQDECGNYTVGVYNIVDGIIALPYLSATHLSGVDYTGIQRITGIITTSGACNLVAQLQKITSGTATCFVGSFMRVAKI